jgi:uncharacterized membrane protein YciS (DUF1049 family)
MESRSSRLVSVVAGVATGSMGAFNLLVAVTFAEQGTLVFMCFIGGLLILISIACFTFTSVVRIDKRKRTIEKTTGLLFWKGTRTYSLFYFSGVGITSGRCGLSSSTHLLV